MKTIKKAIIAVAMVALGAAAAYAHCPDNVMVESGGNVYSCKWTGTTTNGTCTYSNCELIGKKVGEAEAAETESSY